MMFTIETGMSTDEYTHTDMLDVNEFADRDPNGGIPTTAVRYSHLNPNATIIVLHYEDAGRACVVTNGGDEWTDALSIEEAFERYVSDTMIN